MVIYKILRPAEWAVLQAEGASRGAPVDIADGFVHFSTAEQLQGTLERHFAAEGDLVLLAVDEAALGDALAWEPARGGALFPHLHAPLRLGHVAWHAPLPRLGERHALPGLEA